MAEGKEKGFKGQGRIIPVVKNQGFVTSGNLYTIRAD
jgi:hypothetical protein